MTHWNSSLTRRAALSGMAASAALLAAKPGFAQAKEKVAISSLKFLSSSPVFIAKERGYFDAEGIDLDIKWFTAAQAVAVAVASGDTDFGITGLTAGFYNLAGKGAVKIVAAQSREEKGYHFDAYFVSQKAYDAGFRTVQQFEGKTVGITTTGSTFHYALGKLAEKRGFKLESMTLKALQTIPNMVAAVQGGQVDAIIVTANNAFVLEQQGAGKIIGWVEDETPWQLGALFAAPKIIDTRRPVVEKFIRAYLKGAQDYYDAYCQHDASGKRVFGAKADALLPIMQKYVEPAPTKEAIELSASYFDPQGRLLVDDIYAQVAWYQANGMVDKDVSAKNVLDLTFIKGHHNVPKN